ncbi:hypothetical protein AAES_162566 [Amazona aestiva]|uniref:Laminin G domain-containing protein n=1 Tax=Amazona aestiva TaxID=12930 RepID=A0A0Q3P0B3_AMAAE|nr:hypothetical protein AAES_162566 [Amazona aestiva]
MNDSAHSLFQHSFQGCMQFIHVDDQLVDLHAVEQGQLGSFANVTIDMCAIIDRLLLLMDLLRAEVILKRGSEELLS